MKIFANDAAAASLAVALIISPLCSSSVLALTPSCSVVASNALAGVADGLHPLGARERIRKIDEY